MICYFYDTTEPWQTMSKSSNNFPGILQNWGVTAFEVEKLHGSRHNFIWKINTSGKKYVLRHARGQEIYVKKQIGVLDYLKNRGFTYKIPQPITTRQNRLQLAQYRSKLFVLYKYIDGKELSVLSSQMSVQAYVQQVGALVARFHIDIKECKSIPDICTERVFTHKPSSYLYTTARKLFNASDPKGAQLKKIASICQQLPARLATFYHSLPKTICHSDFQGTNILSEDGKKITGLIDFGSIRMRPRICDLTYALKGIASDIGYLNEEIIQTFLSEIDKHEPLTHVEKILMYPFMIQDIALELWWYISRVSNGFYTDRHLRMIRDRLKLADWLNQNQEIFTSAY